MPPPSSLHRRKLQGANEGEEWKNMQYQEIPPVKPAEQRRNCNARMQADNGVATLAWDETR